MIEQWEDEYGKWGRDEDGDLYHLERSQKYIDEHPPAEPEPQPPTQEDRIIDLEKRQDNTEPLVERIKTATEIYEENKDKSELSLDDLKTLRIGKLKEECSNAIYAGFVVNGAHFGMNEHDQQNMTQQLLLVVAGQTDNIQWKTKNVGVIELTTQQFSGVANAAKNHKMSEQAKYWDLEQLITAATDKETIKEIEWSE